MTKTYPDERQLIDDHIRPWIDLVISNTSNIDIINGENSLTAMKFKLAVKFCRVLDTADVDVKLLESLRHWRQYYNLLPRQPLPNNEVFNRFYAILHDKIAQNNNEVKQLFPLMVQIFQHNEDPVVAKLTL